MKARPVFLLSLFVMAAGLPAVRANALAVAPNGTRVFATGTGSADATDNPSSRSPTGSPGCWDAAPTRNDKWCQLAGESSVRQQTTRSAERAPPAASESMPLASEVQSDWSIVGSPNTVRPHENVLSAVTCASASDCWAVGYWYRGTGDRKRTLIEHWNGTEWTIVTSPNTSAINGDLLSGVTCVSASDCWAVGYSRASGAEHTLIEHWNGTEWTIVTSPNTGATWSNELLGMTCTSASDCWAVGVGFTGTAYQTLIERWDGTSWAILTSPSANPASYNQLSGVTCTSASDCWAVGYYNAGGVIHTLIERWDGTSWAIVTSPNTLPTQNNSLSGVTCVSASDCWAVGYYITGNADQTLIERWDGTLWTIVTSPNASAAEDNLLSGVTCTLAANCWATGYHYNPADGINHTLIEQWDGTSWAIATSPNATATQDNVLYGVTCASASDCLVVGAYYLQDFGDPNRFISQTLIERWDGTSWGLVTSPNKSIPQPNPFFAATCVSASDCWAVGKYLTNIADQTLIERWDGTSWAIVASPNTSATNNNLLHGVTCASASDCWAVGFYYNPAGGAYQTLIERWDGTSWTIITSPNTDATKENVLYGVTCASASDCWAVGYHYNGSANQTLIERWDGTSWAIVTSPSANPVVTQNNYLFTVTCASASDCWAVGFYYNPAGGAYQTLIERWDGTSWTIITSPNTDATKENFLYGVTCASASDCWAVGYHYTGSAFQTLIERWDGTSWAAVTSPNAHQANVLWGVTCPSASDCWAVGYYYNPAVGVAHSLFERWDGTSWAIVASPNTSVAEDNVLRAVTCPSATDCWALGWYSDSSDSRQTLTMRYYTQLPQTTIDSGPSGSVASTSATFTFSSSKAGSTFECALDGAAFGPCVSPAAYTSLPEGPHTFSVRATDSTGTGSMASRTWTVDTTAPVLTISAGPSGTVNQTSASFTFSANEPATFACSLDAGALTSCTSPKSYADLSDGSHTFAVRATDAAGNVSDPAARSWSVDTLAPVVSIDSGPTGTVASSTASFTFSANEPTSFSCSIDGGAFSSCTSPKTYSDLPDGSHTFSVRGTDGAGNLSSPVSRTWSIDTQLPQTTISSGPSGSVASTSATFTFSSSKAGSTFECALDAGAFGPCVSPAAYTSLPEGPHTFSVRATDTTGTGPAASRNWTVDTVAPVLTISAGPSGTVNQTSASFAFSANEPATFACSLDAGAFTSCTSPKSYADLSDGSHTFSVRATDAAGNTSNTSRSWTVDTALPVTTITSGPSGPTNSTTASFGFSSSKAGSVFACSLDGGSFGACVSPATYTSLTEGSHTFAVRATDPAGNTGPAASRAWIVDTTAPSTSITTGPAALTNARTASFTFTATESASFACSLDGGAFSGCTSPASYPDLSEGTHTFSVRATDTAGNTGVGASRSWEIDGTPPDTLITSGPTGTVTSSTASFSFSATESGATFTCSRDSGPYFACTSPATYTGLGNGTHTLRVRSTDAASNTDATPASRTWTVAVAAPSVPVITSPAQDQVIGSRALPISGTADPGVYVTVLEGTTALRTTTTDSYGAFSTIPLEFSDGAHQLTARASDATGNLSAASAVRRFLVDTVAPAAPVIVTPAEGQMLASSGVTLSGNAEPGALVSVRSGSQTIAMATADEAGKWRVDRTFADGAYQISARASDAAGNQSSVVARSFAVDTTVPAPPVIVTPAEGSVQPGSVQASGTAEPGATVELREGQNVLKLTLADADGDWTLAASFSAGVHTVTAIATDGAGNAGQASANRRFNVDDARPTLAITTPDRSVFAPTIVARIEGTAGDNFGVTSIELRYYDGRGGLVLTRTATCACGTAATPVSWSDSPTLEAGVYSVRVIARDEAGNRSDVASITILRL